MSPKDFPTPTELKILGILFGVPEGLYGLQIVEQGISRGSVYVLLTRLQGKGYVQLQNKADADGFLRPHYRLTAIGTAVVEVANQIHLSPQGA
jgi:hypothetical protein